MSIPSAVFLDTSVFDGQSYNFTSTAFATFLPACKQRNLKLLLPDPIEHEIRRHMVERSHEAFALLEKARRTAPFLANWNGVPLLDERKGDSPLRRTGEIYTVIQRAWSMFVEQFDVIPLNYDGVNIAMVMDWYHATEPPFGTGKKRKEFPDALAVAILSGYAEQHHCYVAVVSQDTDLKKACDRLPSLMYFQSLPALTELLLSAEDCRIDALKAVLEGCAGQIANAAADATIDLSFYSRGDYSEIEESEVRDLNLTDMRIVALGEHECTVAFDAVIDVTHRVVWYQPSPDDDYEHCWEDVMKQYDVSGTAKVSLDSHTDMFVGIPYVSLNEDELEAIDLPPYWGRR